LIPRPISSGITIQTIPINTVIVMAVVKNNSNFDVLVTDIDHEMMDTIIVKELDIPYLSKAMVLKAREVVKQCTSYTCSKYY
jgi:hypothetical protein